ncbi:hypothetical protein PHMEG_00034419 [Phytophthora megakarya]|uniref:Uncharacterized protein n=1 Tax=Phytophthora megakarya TaxID=4795 RepID=A0A225URF9_9STRA|nr:hypothetical protein PHMEG_00034419 [Phytophthora megakarya]
MPHYGHARPSADYFNSNLIVLCFLLTGHSHNIADRVVAWCRGAVRKFNVYTPFALVDNVNKVKSVSAVFLDHNDSQHPFLVSLSNISSIRKAVLADLFGPRIQAIWEASIREVELPRHPTKELSEKKMKSLAAKYFSIPKQHLYYYPSIPESIINAPSLDDTQTAAIAPAGGDRNAKKRRLGRPKKQKSALKQAYHQFSNFSARFQMLRSLRCRIHIFFQYQVA